MKHTELNPGDKVRFLPKEKWNFGNLDKTIFSSYNPGIFSFDETFIVTHVTGSIHGKDAEIVYIDIEGVRGGFRKFCLEKVNQMNYEAY